jgi:hypothetical protein
MKKGVDPYEVIIITSCLALIALTAICLILAAHP